MNKYTIQHFPKNKLSLFSQSEFRDLSLEELENLQERHVDEVSQRFKSIFEINRHIYRLLLRLKLPQDLDNSVGSKSGVDTVRVRRHNPPIQLRLPFAASKEEEFK